MLRIGLRGRSSSFVSALVLVAAPLAAQRSLPEPTPPASWVASVTRDIARSELAFHRRDDGAWSAPNRSQGLRVRVESGAILLEPRDAKKAAAPWRCELATRAIGRGSSTRSPALHEVRAETARLELERDGCVEWLVNDERGVEHGWTLSQPVAGERDALVTIELALQGDLTAAIAEDGRSASLRDGEGTVVLRYRDLSVLDANGRELDARIVGIQDGLAIRFDDRGARYPIVVDPLITGPAWTSEANQANAQHAISVQAAGDLNADGFGDVVVGAWFYDNGQADEGRAYVYYGSPSGPALVAGWTGENDNPGAFYGVSVAGAGDVNGDGVDDLLIGACTTSNPEPAEGSAYVYLGSPSGVATTPVWSVESNVANVLYGISVATAGDVNGDGYADILVGGIHWTNGQNEEGKAWLYLGGPSGPSTSEAWSVEGNQAGAFMGNCVASAGDVNADGFSDVIVDASTFANGQAQEGKAYLFLGSAAGLATSPAWTFEGNQASAFFGNPCASAGDVNGDGYGDVICGAAGYDNGQVDEGRAYVFLGGAAGLASSPAWIVESDQAGAGFGTGASSAGDVNGDGFADVIVGAPLFDAGQTDEGRAFVYLGGATGLATTPAWTAESDQAGADFGRWVAAAGDVNGDGYGDVLVGAPKLDNGQVDEGRAYLYVGSANGPSIPPSWTSERDQAGAQLGQSIASAGDVNGDGYSDVVVGAWFYDDGEADEGAAFVYLGSPNGLATTHAWSAESDNAGALFGVGVSTAGDVNGDGYDDVLVGACSYSNGEALEGAVYVYLGSPTGPSVTPAWQVESDQPGALLGISVASGDANGDGFSDVLAGAFEWSNGESMEGQARLWLGSPAGLSIAPSWTFESDQANALLGNSVSFAGDVNRDGYEDVVLGAPTYSNGQASEGIAWLFLGSATGLGATPAWSFEGNQASAFVGNPVARGGDVNGDGYADVLIGAAGFDNGQVDEGRAYAFLGSPTGLSPTPAWSVESNQIGARLGTGLACAGDVNGDGYSDVIVGAPKFDNGQTDEGRALLYLGGASGLSTVVAWNTESNQAFADYGRNVASAGDVDGDGYSDVLVAAPLYDDPEVDEGRAYLFHGNDASGLARAPRQARGDGLAPIALLGNAEGTAFRVRTRARSASGRARVALEYELKPLGVPFDGTGRVRSATSTDTGAPSAGGAFVELEELATGLAGSAPYRWRVRTLSNDARFRHSPWTSVAGNAITEGKVGASSGTGVAFCFGDGSATACPCGNASALGAGEGCSSSIGHGARLEGAGVASLSVDTVVLGGVGMTGTSALFFQGTELDNGGAGSTLGDGLLCLGGTLIRLGVRTNAGGAAQFGAGLTQLVSIRGQITQPGARRYQVWYRNAAAGFCPPATFNLSNGLELVWGP